MTRRELTDAQPSRSARKREALSLQELGVRLTQLAPARLEALALPETLLEALLEYRRLRDRAALARQRQYIGRLMRELDAGPVAAALGATAGAHDVAAAVPVAGAADDKLRR